MLPILLLPVLLLAALSRLLPCVAAMMLLQLWLLGPLESRLMPGLLLGLSLLWLVLRLLRKPLLRC